MTRVLCPYTTLHRATVSSLATHAPSAELIDVSGSDFDYFAAVLERWTGDVDLIIVEHDQEIHGDVLPSFAACRRPWCVFPYDHMSMGNLLDSGLGCVRFTAELQQAVPFAALLDTEAPVPGSWRHLDGQIAALLDDAGIERHVHGPPIIHWNKHLRRP